MPAIARATPTSPPQSNGSFAHPKLPQEYSEQQDPKHNGNGNSHPPMLRRDSTARERREKQYEQARVTFDKTVSGHYRHGKTGYTRVGVLFLTWAEDDMQCKETEVDRLRDIFAADFKFETDYYEIPSERWRTGLLKKVAAFMWDYDSPDCLAIIYYGGHGYEGKETREFKLAAKVLPTADGDPTVFFSDIRNAARAPACDQLMIIDCCFASKAFTREHIGKRKFELLTSAAHDAESDAPNKPGSFTRILNTVLPQLLEENPTGFSTAHLFRELYHDAPKTKPQLFDQSRHSYGKIWLRPQMEPTIPNTEEESTYLTLTLRLNEQPEGAVMNQLASHLQFLPYVDHVRFKELYAPSNQLADFMRFVLLSQKLRPLIRKLHARRQIHKALDKLKTAHNKDGWAPSSSLVGLHLAQKNQNQSVYDWSSARQHPKRRRGSESPEPFLPKRAKSSTWPPPRLDEPS
ncbi:hypothetical protein MMC21_006625 [Puttea exsequens]|nr:hypothetical protein [Puttea exsequens]